jgi:hypothetical protein
MVAIQILSYHRLHTRALVEAVEDQTPEQRLEQLVDQVVVDHTTPVRVVPDRYLQSTVMYHWVTTVVIMLSVLREVEVELKQLVRMHLHQGRVEMVERDTNS